MKKYIADLHIHSHFSRATSPRMTLDNIFNWASIKGIDLVGTGDFTHPGWIAEIEEKTDQLDNGLLHLKKEHRSASPVPNDAGRRKVLFLPSAEVALVYKKGGVCRKVHLLLYMPNLESIKKLNSKLAKVGNIAYDGRPIIGLDSRVLLEMMLEISEDSIMIPAHAWTPHFAVFGSRSGFDSLKECFDDLTPLITAIETGLSSDPPMNRRISALDNLALVSNSDAHSLENLGREATIFKNTELSYSGFADAVRQKSGELETLEFFPEEGKYHLDGHRACNVSMTPEASLQRGNICPACGRGMTLGVLYRTNQLADRTEPLPSRFEKIVPLMEIIAESLHLTGAKGKKVMGIYFRLIETFGNEFAILLDLPVDDIGRVGGERLAAAISNMRAGKTCMKPGFDGQYGKISLIPNGNSNFKL